MATDLSEWRDFFVTTATVAGALVGLLFVAVSVHLRVLSDETYMDLRDNARAILLGYVVAMTLSLFPLIPQSLAALGGELLIVFVFIVVSSARSAPQLFRSSNVFGRRNRWFRVGLLVIGCAATLAGGVALLAGQTWPVQLLAASVIVLILVSVFRTWDIVFRAARVAPVD
jgi:hypothetical protein